ncbi:hypothetical protein [Moorena sp. SIO4G3]|uniref:hypothetical protein n=1 Tax=Moorena sp. SIO4G3 TaxID=2607821 RepID=UPI00142900A5|nr:hypothetical protein [Moorena sp. SIO4G3]NEO75863.1 hypothetical protein [Moorena sp. SIO4G3]
MGLTTGHATRTQNGNIFMGLTKSHATGLTKSHATGLTKSHATGLTKSHATRSHKRDRFR